MIANKDVDSIFRLARELANSSKEEGAISVQKQPVTELQPLAENQASTEKQIAVGETLSSVSVPIEVDEYKLRSAVSRAYYSVFLLARHKTRVTDTNDVHSKVVGAVKYRSKSVADSLYELKEYRQSADYDFPPKEEHKDWERNWTVVNKKAANLLAIFKRW